MIKLFLTLFLLCFSSTSQADIFGTSGSLTLKDEGVDQGSVDSVNCVGSAIVCAVSGANGTLTISASGGAQTPWAQAIDGAGFALTNAGNVGIGTNTAVSALTVSGLTTLQVSSDPAGNRLLNTAFVGATGSTPPTSWSIVLLGTGSNSVSGGNLTIADGTNDVYIYQSVTTVIGSTYTVSTVVNSADANAQLVLKIGNSANNSALFSGSLGVGTAGTVSGSFVATATTTFMTLYNAAGAVNQNIIISAPAFTLLRTGGQVLNAAGSASIGYGNTPTVPAASLIVSGNIGIGSINPGKELDVQGMVRAIAFIQSSGSAANTFTGNIGVGSVNPGAQMDVNGTVRMTGFKMVPGASAGYILTSSSVGLGTWMPPPSGSAGSQTPWASDIDGATFRLTNAGNIGVGSTAPGAGVDVKDNIIRAIQNAQTVQGGTLYLSDSSAQAGSRNWAISNACPSCTYGQLAIYSSTGIGTQPTGNPFVKITPSAFGINLGATTPVIPLEVGGNIAMDGVATSLIGNASNNMIGQTSNTALKIGETSGWTSGVTLYPGGSTPTFFQSNGNVGIGSLTPGQVLDVQGTIRATGGLILLGNAGAQGQVLMQNNVGIGTWSTLPSGSGSGTVNSGVINFLAKYPATGTTVDDSAVIMDDGTNVGIGTITPKALLTVNSSIAQDLFRVDDSAGTDTTPFIIDQTGNVGVGTAVPLALLSVASTLNQPMFRVDDNGDADASPFIIDANGNVGIGTSLTQTDKLLVMGGNVGIGTWVPATALDVKGMLIVSSNVGINTLTPGQLLDVQGTTRSLAFVQSAGTLFNTYVGNVGIGSVNPGHVLDVQGTVRSSLGGIFGGTGASNFTSNVGIGSATPLNTLAVVGSASVGSAAYGGTVGPSNGLIVSGNVGIGSVSPGQLLDVVGTIRTTGLVSRAGNAIKASLKTAANQACNTTCTLGGCLMGEDTSVLGSFVDCADATADRCICLDGAGG